MARGRGRPPKALAEGPSEVDASSSPQTTPNNAPAVTEAATSTATTAEAVPQGDIVKMKEAITAPFMVYDTATRRIVQNPSYSRVLLAEVRRLQSIALTKLRTPMQASVSYTPKELLYELEAALFCICASASVASNDDPLKYLMSDPEADAAMPQLESFLAHHNAPAKATVALAYCLTEGSSHDILASFLAMLQQRVEKELNPAIDRRRTEDEHKALRSTKNNVQDIAQLLRDLATAYHSIDTPSQVQRRQPQSDATLVDVARSPTANAVPAQMVDEAFYKVLRWILAVDTDRRALKVAAAVAAGHGGGVVQNAGTTAAGTSPSVDAAVDAAMSIRAADMQGFASAAAAVAAASTQGFAKVVDYDPFTGQVTLERQWESQRWGLLLNAKGLLVGLENDLRNSSEAGERLYDAVQQQSGEAGGLAIYEVNRHCIRPIQLTEEALESSRADIMQKLRKCLTQPSKILRFSIEKRKQADLTSPHEVLYEVSYQGGESGVGQRCLLMLERASTSITWGLKLKYVKGSPAVLSDFSPHVRLSAASKTFLFDTRGRVRVLKINGKDVAKLSAAEMKELVSGALVLTLNLQVTDENGEVPIDNPSELAAKQLPGKSGEALEEEEEPAAAPEEQADEKKQDEKEAVEGDAAVEGIEQTKKKASAKMAEQSSTVAPVEQSKLDSIAAAIADEFLHQHHGTAEAVATEQPETLPEKEEGPVETTRSKASSKTKPAAAAERMEEEEVDEDAFEELDWAKPTTSIGAPGGLADDHDTQKDAQLAKDAADNLQDEADPVGGDDEHATELALLKQFNLLPEGDTAEHDAVDTGEKAEAEEKEGKGQKQLDDDKDMVTGPDEEPRALDETEVNEEVDDGDGGAESGDVALKEKGEKQEADVLEDGEELKAVEEAEITPKKPRGGRKAEGGKRSRSSGKMKGEKGEKEKTRGRKKRTSPAEEMEEEKEAEQEGKEEIADNEAKEVEARAHETAPAVEGETPAKAVEEAPSKKKPQRKTVEEPKKESKTRGRAASKVATAAEEEDAEDDVREKGDANTDAAAANAEKHAESHEVDAPALEVAAATAATAAVEKAALVDLPPTTAEVAIAEGKKTAATRKRGRPSKSKTTEEAQEEAAVATEQRQKDAEAAAEDSVVPQDNKTTSQAVSTAAVAEDGDTAASRVSLNELVHAAPLTFENNVTLEKFDGSTLALQRTNVRNPWDIKVAFAGDDIIMTKLPPIPKGELQHPFLRSLGAGPHGEVKWVVEALNGQDLSLMNRALKTKALGAIKGSTKLAFVLKALRK